MISPNLLKKWTLPESIVLTPNKRLAEFISDQINQWHASQDNKAWSTPAVFPIAAWIQQLWQTAFQYQLVPPCLLLNDQQIHILWRQILAKTDPTLTTLTDIAIKAWQLSQDWQLNIDSEVFTYNEDTALWQQWAQAWQHQLDHQQWLDVPTLNQTILESLPQLAQQGLLPKNIYVINIIQNTPWQDHFFKQLANLGINVNFEQTQNISSTAHCYVAEDAETEIKQMAQWAKQKIQQDNCQRVGCLIADQSISYQKIKQIFTKYLPDNKDWDLGLARKLSEFNIIQHALFLLQLLLPEISANTISQLLLSPFIKSGINKIALRSQMDFLWRQQFTPLLDKKKLSHYIAKAKNICNEWQTCFLQISAIDTKFPRSPAQWLIIFDQVWQAFAWPGDRTLTSEEFQLINYFNQIKSNFARLSLVQAKLSLTQAIDHFTNLIEKTKFFAEVTTQPKIFINTLDAVGLPFDALWIAGMHNEAWPPAIMPNPFIPYPLQQEKVMPYSSTAEITNFSQKTLRQLMTNATEIIFSYPSQAQEKKLHATALIEALPIIDFKQEPNLSIIAPAWEFYQDDYAPILTEQKTYGSEIFKDQASCPFRAFARHRLHAQSLVTPSLGLTYSQRGQILHRILETIWQQLRDQKELLALDQIALITLIEIHIQNACGFYANKYFLISAPAFFNLEKQRLMSIVTRWLNYERQRSPFTVVAIEDKLQINFAGLDLKLRIDRIDQLENQQHLLIDYKSGKCSSEAWLDERMDEPQLPLYAITNPLSIDSLGFAQLHPEDIRLRALSEKYNIGQLKLQWQQQLEGLAKEFQQGYAAVTPKKFPETCNFCDLGVLCRVKCQ